MILAIVFLSLMSAGSMLAAAAQPSQTPAEKQAPRKTSQKKTAAKPAATGELTVPKDAVKLNDLEWRWVAKDGKKWIYRRTPFGLSRFEEEAPAAKVSQAPSPAPSMTARDLGDEVEFSRRTPFGQSAWRKKKTELDSDERAALAAANQSSGAKQ